MFIDIYRSAINGNKFLSVPSGTDVGATLFPGDLDRDLLKLSLLSAKIDLSSGEPRVGLDVGDVHAQIAEKGYATHTLKITIHRNTLLG